MTLAPCVCASLRQTARVLTQLYDDRLRPSGLTAQQFHLLSTVSAMGEPSLGQLERVMLIDQTTLTRGVRLMEDRGLLERVPQKDKRLKILRLTAEGGRRLAAAAAFWTAVQAEVVEGLGGEDWARLHGGLARLADSVWNRGGGTEKSAGEKKS